MDLVCAKRLTAQASLSVVTFYCPLRHGPARVAGAKASLCLLFIITIHEISIKHKLLTPI